MKKIYIIGAGGFGRETAWLIERINQKEAEPVWEIQGFLDEDKNKYGTRAGRYYVAGGCEVLGTCKEEIWAVCAIGNAGSRKRMVEKASAYEQVRFAVLKDPDAVVSPFVTIGEGSIICAKAVVTVDISIGRHVIVSMDSTVGHDAVIEDFVTIYPGANVSGSDVIGQEAEIGAGSQIIQGKRIGKGTIVGAGAVVIQDLPEGCTAAGVPAKKIRECRSYT